LLGFLRTDLDDFFSNIMHLLPTVFYTLCGGSGISPTKKESIGQVDAFSAFSNGLSGISYGIQIIGLHASDRTLHIDGSFTFIGVSGGHFDVTGSFSMTFFFQSISGCPCHLFHTPFFHIFIISYAMFRFLS